MIKIILAFLAMQPIPDGQAIQHIPKWHREPVQLAQVIKPEDSPSRKLEQIVEAGGIFPDIVEEYYGKDFKDAFTYGELDLFSKREFSKEINHYEDFKKALLKFNSGDYEAARELFESVLKKENYKELKNGLLAFNAKIEKLERKLFGIYEKTDTEEGKHKLFESVLEYLELIDTKKSYIDTEKNIRAIVSALDGMGQASFRLASFKPEEYDKALEMYSDIIYLFENKVNDIEIKLGLACEYYARTLHASLLYLKEKKLYEKEDLPYEKTNQGIQAWNIIRKNYNSLKNFELPKFFYENLGIVMEELKII